MDCASLCRQDGTVIRNILFDFGNVLYDLDEARTEGLLREVLDPLKCGDLEEQVLHPYERGECSEEAFINRLQRRSHTPRDGSYYLHAWNAMLLGMPSHRLAMLGQLRKRYALYLLSNINRSHLSALRRQLAGMPEAEDFEQRYFDAVFYSCEIGHRKPEPKCFHYVLAHAGILAGESLFVDDRSENIEAARRLGFRVHRHDPASEIGDSIFNLVSES